MRIIGDVHGNILEYQDLWPDNDQSIQIGDMGIGFKGIYLEPSLDHKFFRGNHDSPQLCLQHENYLGDWGCKDEIFWYAGADSIDKAIRKPYVSWWPDEELSFAQAQMALQDYEQAKPRIMLSHDCPQTIMELLFAYRERSQTRLALESMFQIHQPDLWIFGHHHVNTGIVAEGTRFICRPELGYIDL